MRWLSEPDLHFTFKSLMFNLDPCLLVILDFLFFFKPLQAFLWLLKFENHYTKQAYELTHLNSNFILLDLLPVWLQQHKDPHVALSMEYYVLLVSHTHTVAALGRNMLLWTSCFCPLLWYQSWNQKTWGWLRDLKTTVLTPLCPIAVVTLSTAR